MLSHSEMIGLQAEKHELTDEDAFTTAEQFVLHLMHVAAYQHAARVTGDKSVLDIGCNTGYGTKLLSGHAQKAVGVDVSERAIDLAIHKYGGTGVDFQVIDGIGLPFGNNSFDVVTCFQLIEHLVEHDSFMSEVKRVLKPGGIVVFTTPNASLRLDPGMKPWNEFHVREYTADEIGPALDRYFKNVRVLALYGREPVHRIVVERADRIRRAARSRNSAAHSGEILRTRLKSLGRRLSRAQSPAPPSLNFAQANYHPEDFRYQTSGLATGLEFLAICSEDDIIAHVESLADRTITEPGTGSGQR